MRLFPAILGLGLILGSAMEASVLPITRLEAATLAIFHDYVARFEQKVSDQFAASGKLWIDDDRSGKRRDFDAGKPVTEARQNQDIKNGSIHHYSGAIRIPGAKIEQVRRVMQDYSNYMNYFKPDIVRSSGVLQPDSTPEDEHYQSRLFLSESTFGIDVAYDARYDSHYRRLDANRWVSSSTTMSIRELRDAKKPEGSLYPEGEDHGFLWRSNTYWYVRERDGGLDLQLDSMSLSRTAPTGFGWWGNRRTREAVEKMLRDTKTAVQALR